MNYQLLLVMILSVIVMLGFFSIVTPALYATIPSEEKCRHLSGYGIQEKAYAEKMFCEFNVTGWHFNRTKYIEVLSKTENYVT